MFKPGQPVSGSVFDQPTSHAGRRAAANRTCSLAAQAPDQTNRPQKELFARNNRESAGV